MKKDKMTEQEKEKKLEKFKVKLREDGYWRIENKLELIMFSIRLDILKV